MGDFSAIRNYVSRFVTFTEEEWKAHEVLLVKKTVPKGEYLLRAGEVCNHVTFINKGYFRVYNIVDDQEFTTNFAFDGNYVTDFASFVSRQPTFSLPAAFCSEGNIAAVRFSSLNVTG